MAAGLSSAGNSPQKTESCPNRGSMQQIPGPHCRRGFSPVLPSAAGPCLLIKNGNSLSPGPDNFPDDDCRDSDYAAKTRQHPNGPANTCCKQHYYIHFFSLFSFLNLPYGIRWSDQNRETGAFVRQNREYI